MFVLVFWDRAGGSDVPGGDRLWKLPLDDEMGDRFVTASKQKRGRVCFIERHREREIHSGSSSSRESSAECVCCGKVRPLPRLDPNTVTISIPVTKENRNYLGHTWLHTEVK